MTKKKILEISRVTFLLVTTFSLIQIRAHLVEAKFGSSLDCRGCFAQLVISSDLVIVYITIGVLLLAGLIRSSILRRTLHLGIGVVLTFYVADLIVFTLFSYRLFFADIVLYVRDWAVVWEQFSSGLGGIWMASMIAAAVIAMALLLYLMPPARGWHTRLILFVFLAAAIVLDVSIDSRPYVNSWLTDNVIRVNLGTSERVEYTPGVVSEISKSQPSINRVLSASRAQSGRNVILVIVESWSSWHSKGFGGIYDWTPHLDAAARRGRQYSNLHGIGFATANGLVGILTGQNIWSPFLPLLKRTPFHSQWGHEKTVPIVFSNHGYETAFLTTGPLTLYRKGEWMHDIGFDHVEGGDHPSYAGEKRYVFNSPSDAALYRRALEWMNTANTPYFLVLETVSTHQPFVDPVSGDRSLEKAMRYADYAFGEFLHALDDKGFFDQGLLVVASDHRSMTPISIQELEQLGPNAVSRTPAFILGREFDPGTVDNRVFSQADLLPTLEMWLSGSTEISPQDGIMIGDFQTSKCAFHERGDRRGHLLVTCPEGYGEVYLDGDNTRFVESTGLSENREDLLLMTIARERIAGLRRHGKVVSKSEVDQADQ